MDYAKASSERAARRRAAEPGCARSTVQANSPQPTQLKALTYAQGHDNHLALGHERHLPHEAWHAVLQAEAPLQPTTQMNDGARINDDPGLEHKADVMGERAASLGRRDA